MRAIWSVEPPAPNGTTMLTGRCGKSAAIAAVDPAAITTAAMSRLNFIISQSP